MTPKFWILQDLEHALAQDDPKIVDPPKHIYSTSWQACTPQVRTLTFRLLYSMQVYIALSQKQAYVSH